MSEFVKYPQSDLIRDWEKLIKMDREDVVELLEKWDKIEKANSKISKHNHKEKWDKIMEIADDLSSKGVKVKKYKSSGKSDGYHAWFVKNVQEPLFEKYPKGGYYKPTAHMGEREVHGIKIYNNQSPTNVVELYDKVKRMYNSKKNESEKVDKLLIKSIEYAALNDINIEDMNSKDIIQAVQEDASENYLHEECPDGTEVYLKHECDECDQYIAGERRCECGNRRINIQVEGDILNGFHYYPEAW